MRKLTNTFLLILLCNALNSHVSGSASGKHDEEQDKTTVPILRGKVLPI